MNTKSNKQQEKNTTKRNEQIEQEKNSTTKTTSALTSMEVHRRIKPVKHRRQWKQFNNTTPQTVTSKEKEVPLNVLHEEDEINDLNNGGAEWKRFEVVMDSGAAAP